MTPLPPVFRDQRKVDAEHLRLLAIFHFVVSGLALVGLGFLLIHYAMMSMMFSNPEMWKSPAMAGPPPEKVFSIFKWFYLFMAVCLVAGGVGNLISGLFIRKRTNRVFSIIVAGINCIQFPFGTALGVFTFVVLLRDTVRQLYSA